MTKTISGIFYFIAPTTGDWKEHSRKFLLGLAILVIGTLAIVGSFIAMALRSNSGIGIYVVGFNILCAFI